MVDAITIVDPILIVDAINMVGAIIIIDALIMVDAITVVDAIVMVDAMLIVDANTRANAIVLSEAVNIMNRGRERITSCGVDSATIDEDKLSRSKKIYPYFYIKQTWFGGFASISVRPTGRTRPLQYHQIMSSSFQR